MIETERLILRNWTDADVQPMYAIHQDTNVMEYLGGLKDLDATLAYINRLVKHYDQYGYTLYACDVKATKSLIGFIGLRFFDYLEKHVTPMPEIAWRLSFDSWGQGYATEGAKAVLEYGFCKLDLSEIISIASACNQRSVRVMEKIGLQHDPKDDFDHPNLADDSPFRKMVLYRITQAQYVAKEIV